MQRLLVGHGGSLSVGLAWGNIQMENVCFSLLTLYCFVVCFSEYITVSNNILFFLASKSFSFTVFVKFSHGNDLFRLCAKHVKSKLYTAR